MIAPRPAYVPHWTTRFHVAMQARAIILEAQAQCEVAANLARLGIRYHPPLLAQDAHPGKYYPLKNGEQA